MFCFHPRIQIIKGRKRPQAWIQDWFVWFSLSWKPAWYLWGTDSQNAPCDFFPGSLTPGPTSTCDPEHFQDERVKQPITNRVQTVAHVTCMTRTAGCVGDQEANMFLLMLQALEKPALILISACLSRWKLQMLRFPDTGVSFLFEIQK